ncbi:hypothetical protein JCM14469_15000 [Desulfatiferula olefinivorans]
MGGRVLKKRLESLLLAEPWNEALTDLAGAPPRQSINALISFFCSLSPLLKWRAVSAAGTVTAGLADHSPEEARVIMRRLMWTLNDESGGIGWGAPEAMGDIMAKSPVLASEYNRILVSYLDEDGNYLEHEPLQTGLLWSVYRLAGADPARIMRAAAFTRPFLSSADPEKRGLACLIAGALRDHDAKAPLTALLADPCEITLYSHGYFHEKTIQCLSEHALKRIVSP